MELLLAKEGKFYYMDDVMSVYRKHGSGISAELNKNKVDMADKLIDLLNRTKPLYGSEYAIIFDESIMNYRRMREVFVKEAFYDSHPIARLFRPKTYKRMIKKKLRSIVQ